MKGSPHLFQTTLSTVDDVIVMAVLCASSNASEFFSVLLLRTGKGQIKFEQACNSK